MSLVSLLAWFIVAQPLPAPQPTAVCIGCRVDLAQVRGAYSANEWEKLMRGEIITSRSAAGSQGAGLRSEVRGAAVLACRADQLWEVITDFAARC